MRIVWILPVIALAGCAKPEDSAPGGTPDPSAAPGAAPGEMASAPAAPGTGGPIQPGSKVTFHYQLKADGKVQQDSHAGQPGMYVQGAGQVFPALERALEGLKPGDKKSVTLKPEEAFGPRVPDALKNVPRSSFPNADSMKVGDTIGGSANGQRITAVIQKIGADSVTVDMNHPLAGKAVTFDVEIVSVQ